MRPKKETVESRIRDNIIECKDILIRQMRKTNDIKEVQAYSKAIGRLDAIIDIMDGKE